MREKRMINTILDKTPGERVFGRSGSRWEDNTELNLREVSFDGRRWMKLDYTVVGLFISGVGLAESGVS